jgi:hypothetical protein
VPRFVILEHDHPVLHWDLLLETGPVLRGWRLLELPRAGVAIAAEVTFDHRLIYLDYEGPVSGNRGTVRRWDEGTYELEVDSADELNFRLTGQRVAGTARLRRVEGDRWEFVIGAPATE